MALIECPDCQGKVSDAAPACIHCGLPIARPGQAAAMAIDQQEPTSAATMGWASKTILWLAAGFVAVMAIGLANLSPEKDAARFAEKKAACSMAIASSIGTSTTGYADKAAHDARIREACAGLEINGKDLGNHGR